MSENVYKSVDGTIVIINGGDPLPGCPQSWEEAYKLEEWLNDGKGKEDKEGPCWDFDCGFKLDFDGPLISVSSRFYPPKTHSGATWDGGVSIYLKGEVIASKTFDCPTVQELKQQVDEFVNSISDKILNAFK